MSVPAAERTLRVAAVIGADGAYSPTAKALGLPNLPRCVAIQERVRLPADKMARWEDTADLYLGPDVSPDLYAWAFPKKDHVAVGIGAGPGHTKAARQLPENLKQRIAPELAGGEFFLQEAHALPMHPRPQIAFDRAMLVGDAAGLVVGTSGEGIYWAMKERQNGRRDADREPCPTLISARAQRYQQPGGRATARCIAFCAGCSAGATAARGRWKSSPTCAATRMCSG